MYIFYIHRDNFIKFQPIYNIMSNLLGILFLFIFYVLWNIKKMRPYQISNIERKYN